MWQDQGEREGGEEGDLGAGGGGGRAPSNGMRTASHHKTPCNEVTSL